MSFSIQSLYTWFRNTLRNPKYRWWVILGTFAYLLSPFDIAPDFLPIIGQIDDIAIVSLMVAELSQIAIEYFKSRQVTAETSDNNHSTISTNTVEVEAKNVL